MAMPKLRIEKPWLREFLSEFAGTFVLVLIGESSMAHLVLKKQNDVFAAVVCWGIAVMMGVLTALSNSGGHVNPAVTTSMAMLGKMPWSKVPHYILGQHLGSFVACGLLYANNKYIIDAFDGGVRESLGPKGTGVLWTTFADPNVPLGICVLDTIICSAMLLFGIMVILDHTNTAIPKPLIGLHVGFLVIGVCWAMGSNCMAAVNPARDFPPRVLAVLVGYSDVFSIGNFWWVPLFIPHVGAFVGAFLYEILIGNHTPRPELERRREEEGKPMI